MSFLSGSPILESTTNSPNDNNLNPSPAGAFTSAGANPSNELDDRASAGSQSATTRFAEVTAIVEPTRESHSTVETRSRTVLHEFQSLLEAAQRIADGAGSSLSRDSLPSDLVDPIIRRTNTVSRLPQALEGRRRVPLTRHYSGRPHVPGEDSGSEHEDGAQGGEEELSDSEDLFNQLGYTRLHRADLDSLLDDHNSSDFVGENLRRMERARAQMEAYRARDSQSSIAEQMERDRESLRQAVAMTRELRRNQSSRTLYHEETVASGPLFSSPDARPRSTEHSLSSVRSQPYTLTTNSGTTTNARPRSRSNSVRRWRPAERLQDYASSHTRRSSRDDHTSNSHAAVQATTAGIPLAWRNQAEGSRHAIRTGGTRTQEREHTVTGNTSEERMPSSIHQERLVDPWSDSSWSSEVGTRSSRTEQNDHDEIVSRVERALQEYRLSRRNLRASQEESNVYPLSSRATLAELSAARASRRQTSTSFLPELPGPFNWEDRWRRDDAVRRRNAEQTREHRRRYLHRLQTTLEGLQESERRTREINDNISKEINESMKVAKASLQYLARLRDSKKDTARAWTAAAELGLHNKSLHETPNDSLPASVDDLPVPCACSWLEPGMQWSGTQSADEEKSPSRRSMEGRMQEYEARARSLRDVLNYPQPDSMYDFLENPTTQPASSYTGMRNARLRELALHEELMRPKTEPARVKDHWEVKAVLHSVDWEEMTLTGTMTASQIRGLSESESATCDSSQNDGASMDSFFTGEIVDFLHFGLDTPSSAEREASGQNSSYRDKRQQNDWKVGGPEADLIHWAGIGPFKQEIDRIVERRRRSYDRIVQKLNTGLQDPVAVRPSVSEHEETESDTVAGETEPEFPHPPNYTEPELSDLKLDTMHKVLTDKKWLNEHINSEGWVLMRWKERCFVSPGTSPNPEPTRPWIPTRAPAAHARSGHPSSSTFDPDSRQDTQRIYSTNEAEREELRGPGRVDRGNNAHLMQPMWGLTISGFYYVALHRQTGRIEALYYDCTSAPYQRLRMGPAMYKSAECGLKSIPLAFEVPGGLRSSFNVVEFR